MHYGGHFVLGAGARVAGGALVPPLHGLVRDALDVRRAIEYQPGRWMLAHRGDGYRNEAVAQMASLVLLGLRLLHKGT